MDTDAASLFWFVVPGVIIPGVLLVLSFWSPNRRQIERWGVACDVVITVENEAMVRSRLGRVRRFRSAASFPFWWLAFVRTVDPGFPPVLATPVIGLGAYLIGALVAELTGARAVPEGVRRASLAARLVGDYRPRWVQRLIVGLGTIAAVATAVRFRLVEDPSGSTRALLTSIALAGVVVVISEVAARRIVRRPQRGADVDRLAADEGLRATAVSMTSGASLLATIGAAAAATGSAVPAATGAWALPLVAWMVALQGMAVGVLVLIVRQETWGYRRRFRPVREVVAA